MQNPAHEGIALFGQNGSKTKYSNNKETYNMPYNMEELTKHEIQHSAITRACQHTKRTNSMDINGERRQLENVIQESTKLMIPSKQRKREKRWRDHKCEEKIKKKLTENNSLTNTSTGNKELK